ncbi:MAG: DUF2335 domain-containing protein [Magnetococcus sp. THC-1_WYH]
MRHSRFEGPLPPPSVMEGYNQVIPGAAERILHMTEESAAFQQKISMAALSAQSSDTRRGQWFAFLVALRALTTGGVAILTRETLLQERPSSPQHWPEALGRLYSSGEKAKHHPPRTMSRSDIKQSLNNPCST